MKKNILISDFCLKSNNRGTAALGYGSIAFLQQKGYLKEDQKIIHISIYRNPLRISLKQIIGSKKRTNINVLDKSVECTHIEQHYLFFLLWSKLGFSFTLGSWKKFINNIDLVTAINGGDGFSDIYGKKMFYSRLREIKIALKYKIPLIFLPQTIGPFKNPKIQVEAERIMKYASTIYVRDTKYSHELDELGIKYNLANDLSAYMQPESWNIKIIPNAIGININGLLYSNNFNGLAGQFDFYPELITKIIQNFQNKGLPIYIISHAYGYKRPEYDNDDLVSSREFYNSLQNKKNVFLIDKDLTSPQVKYVISKMSFFIGSRMHANFAAIFTKVPVWGLAYSFKFQGAFESNGLYNRTTMINNINSENIPKIVNQINDAYESDVVKQNTKI